MPASALTDITTGHVRATTPATTTAAPINVANGNGNPGGNGNPPGGNGGAGGS